LVVRGQRQSHPEAVRTDARCRGVPRRDRDPLDSLARRAATARPGDVALPRLGRPSSPAPLDRAAGTSTRNRTCDGGRMNASTAVEVTDLRKTYPGDVEAVKG